MISGIPEEAGEYMLTFTAFNNIGSDDITLALIVSENIAPGPESEDVKTNPQSEDVKPSPESEDVRPSPQSEDVKPSPKSEDVKPSPESEDVKPSPESDNLHYGLSSANSGCNSFAGLMMIITAAAISLAGKRRRTK